MARHRLLFTKEERAVYLSHLDLMRTITRAFLRAGIAIRHTEGFNPHPYLSIAMPLSVGAASRTELLDFELIDNTALNTIPAALTAYMPEGITVLDAYEAPRKLKEIVWLEISGVLEYDNLEKLEETAAKLTAFFEQDEIHVRKRNKKKEEVVVDIAPMIQTVICKTADVIALNAVIAAQNPSLNPELMMDALRQNESQLAPDFARFRRLAVYDKFMHIFR